MTLVNAPTVVTALVAVVALLQGLRSFTLPWRLRESISRDAGIIATLPDGPTRKELERLILVRTGELVLFENRRDSAGDKWLLAVALVFASPAILLFGAAFYAGFTGAETPAEQAVSVDAVIRICSAIALTLWLGYWFRYRRRRQGWMALRARLQAEEATYQPGPEPE